MCYRMFLWFDLFWFQCVAVNRSELVESCWQFDAVQRPAIEHIISILTANPTLIRPCLDSPSAALVLEGTASLEMSLAPRPRSVHRGAHTRRSSGDPFTRRGLSLLYLVNLHGRLSLLHLPSTEAVSVKLNAQLWLLWS